MLQSTSYTYLSISYCIDVEKLLYSYINCFSVTRVHDQRRSIIYRHEGVTYYIILYLASEFTCLFSLFYEICDSDVHFTMKFGHNIIFSGYFLVNIVLPGNPHLRRFVCVKLEGWKQPSPGNIIKAFPLGFSCSNYNKLVCVYLWAQLTGSVVPLLYHLITKLTIYDISTTHTLHTYSSLH